MARAPHPIWSIVKEQGRSYAWLARKTGFSEGHVRHLACGFREPGKSFRAKAAELLQIPESVLFVAEQPVGNEAA